MARPPGPNRFLTQTSPPSASAGRPRAAEESDVADAIYLLIGVAVFGVFMGFAALLKRV
jgi:hypothetical protein